MTAHQDREGPREYPTRDITVSYDKERCLHALECVHGLPRVFNAARRPWIDPLAAPAEQVAEVVRRCPTGALHYEMHGGAPEAPEHPTRVFPVEGGPNVVRGHLVLRLPNGRHRHETRVALCRCGGTGNAPYCDGSHDCGLTGRTWSD